jgi:DNA-binding NtrC family response regulator
LISATNRNLIEDVKHGRFREDLFYRLHVFPITVPPLAQRPEDIPDLTWHFLARFAAEEGKRIRAIAPAALALLTGHAWPGNVRQLENAVFRAVVLAESDEVGVNEFPQIEAQLAGYRQLAGEAGGPAGQPPFPASLPELPRTEQEFVPPIAMSDADHAIQAIGCLSLLDGKGHVRPLEEIENEAIRFAITHCRGQMSDVARRLRIGRSTLYRKLKELGFDEDAASETGENVASG